MKPEEINQLFSDLQSMDQQLNETFQEWNRLAEKWQTEFAAWEEKVIAIGQALIHARQEYGKGWKQNFKSLGFEFSYTIASRYIACAEHPEARGETNSVEDWAKAAADCKRAANEALAAKEDARTKRAEARKQKEEDSSDSQAANDELESAEADTQSANMLVGAARVRPAVDDESLRRQMQEAFDLLHETMLSNPKLKQLRPHWLLLLEGLRQGLTPRISTVSPHSAADDTIDSGGLNSSELCVADLLNA